MTIGVETLASRESIESTMYPNRNIHTYTLTSDAKPHNQTDHILTEDGIKQAHTACWL
jgi:hypothetical protein